MCSHRLRKRIGQGPHRATLLLLLATTFAPAAKAQLRSAHFADADRATSSFSRHARKPVGRVSASDRGQRSSSASTRRYPAIRLRSTWTIGGDDADTTFLLPFSLTTTAQHFVVYDAIARRVVALSPISGKEAWRFGRAGRGPNEFGGIAFVSPRPAGGVRILDLGNQRLSSLSEQGTILGRYAYPFGADPRGVCDLQESQVRLRALVDHEIQRVVDDTTVVADGPLPWPELAGHPGLVRQSLLVSHPRGDVCFATLSFGPRFAILDKDGVRATGSWTEPVPLARARSLGKGSWTMMPGSVITTTSATGVGETFAVLFEGRSTQRKRLIDFYSIADASYLFSIVLPFEAKVIGYGHGLLVAMGETSDGAPFVRAMSASPSLETLVSRARAATR